jgi:hypothetical protein
MCSTKENGIDLKGKGIEAYLYAMENGPDI